VDFSEKGISTLFVFTAEWLNETQPGFTFRSLFTIGCKNASPLLKHISERFEAVAY